MDHILHTLLHHSSRVTLVSSLVILHRVHLAVALHSGHGDSDTFSLLHRPFSRSSHRLSSRVVVSWVLVVFRAFLSISSALSLVLCFLLSSAVFLLRIPLVDVLGSTGICSVPKLQVDVPFVVICTSIVDT